MATPVERVIATATKEIGYLEKKDNTNLDDKTSNAGYNNWTKYARDLDALGLYNGRKNGYAWCDMFVDWCMIKTFGLETALAITGQKMQGEGAGCTSSANYYKQMRAFYLTNPKPGDQIFFSNTGGKSMNHTGLVVKVTKSTVYTIEGNTSSAKGVVPNGGSVQNKSYPINYSKIGGYGRPKYDLVKTQEEDDEDMTQEKFNEMMNVWLTTKANEKETWGTEHLEWAKKNEIMLGDAQGRMMPNKFCTRLEMVAMLRRLATKMGMK